MKTPMVSSATSFQRLQTSLQSPMPRLPRSNVYSTQDPANPSASVHRKRFFTPSLTLKFLCAGCLNPGKHILQAYDQKRRVLFFCACEYPGTVHSPNCHRAAVAGLLLKAAHRKGVRLTIAEWPGGEPRIDKLRTSPQEVKKVLRGASRVRLPKLSLKDKRTFAQ